MVLHRILSANRESIMRPTRVTNNTVSMIMKVEKKIPSESVFQLKIVSFQESKAILKVLDVRLYKIQLGYESFLMHSSKKLLRFFSAFKHFYIQILRLKTVFIVKIWSHILSLFSKTTVISKPQELCWLAHQVLDKFFN